MKAFRMVLIGLLLYVVLLLIEAVATIPLGMPAQGPAESFLVWEFFIMAIPAGLVSFLAARLLRLGSRRDALLHALVWTAMYVGILLLISSMDTFGNNNAGILFGTPTIYLLFICYFLGPLLYARARHLPA